MKNYIKTIVGFSALSLALISSVPAQAAPGSLALTQESVENVIIVDPADGILMTPEEVAEIEAQESQFVQAAGEIVTLGEPSSFTIGSITPYVNTATCGNRTDLYRWKNTSGSTVLCWANAGKAYTSNYVTVGSLCPGPNKGQTYYKYGTSHYWSTWRGPMANNNTCYSFGDDIVYAKGINIQ
ncbi:hypothetical protein [Paeniglutamicibacter sp. NPDC091659]|uniref:hypothetical protein n=1 Tax=Paeniglutamicibacter sp. NPDC091659 TaxID=3364389 RepID=UPI00380EE7E2